MEYQQHTTLIIGTGKVTLLGFVIIVFIIVVEVCTDFYANEESNTLKELSDDMLDGYLEYCLSYILICYSSRCITVKGV